MRSVKVRMVSADGLSLDEAIQIGQGQRPPEIITRGMVASSRAKLFYPYPNNNSRWDATDFQRAYRYAGVQYGMLLYEETSPDPADRGPSYHMEPRHLIDSDLWRTSVFRNSQQPSGCAFRIETVFSGECIGLEVAQPGADFNAFVHALAKLDIEPNSIGDLSWGRVR